MPNTLYSVHLGYDDHISGFECTRVDLIFCKLLPDLGVVNDYILENCQRLESTEADLFINMMDEDFKQFHYDVSEVLGYGE